MRASKVLLRWYKSFNTRYYGYSDVADSESKPWETYDGQHFPFVEIPIDRQITTVVGANECGKSHLLSAMAKAFIAHGVGDESEHEYAVQDICRYCAFEGLEKNIWPNIGVELTFDTNTEFTNTLKALGIEASSSADADDEPQRLCVILDGGRSLKQYVQVYLLDSKAPVSSVPKEQWQAACNNALPTLQFIDAKVALANEVHVDQLIRMYRGEEPSTVFDPLALQKLAESFLCLPLESGKPVDPKAFEQYQSIRDQLGAAKVSLHTTGRLETLLFQDVLGIRIETLEQMANLGGESRGYVERLVAEINHRLDEVLDITHFWQQDDEFRLTVDYKSGFFFFEITDKTGAKYTFNERSSGLRFFLSYYIQAKAIEKANEQRGSIVLMDEPDSYLSIGAQRNLLQVFESLVSPKTASGSCQLVTNREVLSHLIHG